MTDRDDLLALIRSQAVVRGDVILSSGQRASWYIDLRRILLAGQAAPLAGRVMLEVTADLSYDAVGGLTLGADPVATAILHAAAARGRVLDAFVVRKAEKAHGLQRRIEGPDVAYRRARRRGHLDDRQLGADRVDALRDAGADVVGGRSSWTAARAAHRRARLRYRAAYELADVAAFD